MDSTKAKSTRPYTFKDLEALKEAETLVKEKFSNLGVYATSHTLFVEVPSSRAYKIKVHEFICNLGGIAQ